RDLQIPRGDRRAALVEDAEPRDRPARPAVAHDHRLLSLAEDPAIAPLAQRGHQGRKVLAPGRELVFVARSVRSGYELTPRGKDLAPGRELVFVARSVRSGVHASKDAVPDQMGE